MALSVLAACDDDGGTGPDGVVDPSTASAVVDSVVQAFFSANEALRSLAVLGPFIYGITGQTNLDPLSFGSPRDGRSISGAARRIRSSFERLYQRRDVGSRVTASIPATLLGLTLIWDPVDSRYIADPNDDGAAPANGVRFRIYAPDPETRLPVVPLEDIGYVDIVDLSDFDQINVSVEAVVRGTTLLDYSVRGALQSDSFDLIVAGHVSDGADRLNFGFNVASADGGSSARFSLNLGTFLIGFEFGRDGSGAGSNTVSITDTASDGVIEFIFEFDADGRISDDSGASINGERVAVLSGTTEGAFLSRSDGSPLSSGELQALARLFEAFGSIFGTLADLFEFGLAVAGRLVSL